MSKVSKLFCTIVVDVINTYHIIAQLQNLNRGKINKTMNMADFRPISCVNTIYKLLVKILADRISKVIPELNSPIKQPLFKADSSLISDK